MTTIQALAAALSQAASRRPELVSRQSRGGGVDTMSYSQAMMILHNPNAYGTVRVREAALYILSKLGALKEDIRLAAERLVPIN